MITIHQPVIIWMGREAFHKYKERGGNFASFWVAAVQNHLHSQAGWLNISQLVTSSYYTTDYCPVLNCWRPAFPLGVSCVFVREGESKVVICAIGVGARRE